MNKEKSKIRMAERFLNHALEIIYMLTGEEYTIVKKNTPHSCFQQISGEVPIKCDDVAVYFSLEEWEYIEGHKELYQDLMMENPHTTGTVPSPENLGLQDEYVNHATEDGGHDIDEKDILQVTIQSDLCEDKPIRRYNTRPRRKSDRSEGFGAGDNCVIACHEKQSNYSLRRVKAEECVGLTESIHKVKNVCAVTNCKEEVKEAPETTRIHKSLASRAGSHNPQHHIPQGSLHTRHKLYACPQCEKCFTQKLYLLQHQKLHTGEKEYKCSECSKCFGQKSHLMQHQRCHTGEKPYVCFVCGNCFSQKSHLIQHERLHTGERPFLCSVCGIRFKQKAHLMKHQKHHR
ncbi:gastrula zinc finger protein XlCGF66.1-like isoform 3-T4 [Discoglossus pictus]